MNKSNLYKVGGRFSTITGVLMVLGAFLGLPMSPTIFNEWRVVILAHQYSEEIFIIESVGFGKMTRNGAANIPIAQGSVNGNSEEISLLGFELAADSLADLEAALPQGSQLDILYDPSASRMFTQGRTLRALPSSTSFDGAWIRALGITMIPILPLMVGGIGQAVCIKKRRTPQLQDSRMRTRWRM